MVDTTSMTVILAMWTMATWAFTYVYMKTKLDKVTRYVEHLEKEYGDLMDDWHEHYIDDRLMDYAEYKLNEDGTWNEVF